MSKFRLRYTLALAPLLLGAGNVGHRTEALTVTSLPVCAADQFLSYQGGNLVCITLTGGTTSVSLPNCRATNQLLNSQGSGGDVSTLVCTNTGLSAIATGDVTTINGFTTTLNNINTLLTNLENTPAVPPALYAGPSNAAMTNGKYTQTLPAGTDPGMAAANALCAKSYPAGAGLPDARMCTVYDLYASVVAGKITSAMSLGSGSFLGLYFPTWNNPGGNNNGALDKTSQDIQAGQGDNCGAYTYPTADRVWKNMGFEWNTASSGANRFAFHSGSVMGCASAITLACCR